MSTEKINETMNEIQDARAEEDAAGGGKKPVAGSARRKKKDPKGAQAGEEKEKELSLEEAFAQLERLTQDMQRSDAGLEENFASYQKGMELIRQCREKISRIEKKVELLNDDGTVSVSEELSRTD